MSIFLSGCETPRREKKGKAETEQVIATMLKTYANRYPQNQKILRSIIEANIRKVELEEARGKAKDRINAVISECIGLHPDGSRQRGETGLPQKHGERKQEEGG